MADKFERAPMPHDEEVITLSYVVAGIISPNDILEAEAEWGPHVAPEAVEDLEDFIGKISGQNATTGEEDARHIFDRVFPNFDAAANVLGDSLHWAPQAIDDLSERLRQAFIEESVSQADPELEEWAVIATPVELITYAYNVYKWNKEANEV